MALILKNIKNTIKFHSDFDALNSKIKQLKKWTTVFETPDSLIKYLESAEDIYKNFDETEIPKGAIYNNVMKDFFISEILEISESVKRFYNLDIDILDNAILVFDNEEVKTHKFKKNISSLFYIIHILYNRVIVHETLAKLQERRPK